MVFDIQERTLIYAYPPFEAALRAGRAPRPTRRDWCNYYLWRAEQRRSRPATVDLRAVEAELARHHDLFVNQMAGDGGMTLAEFAEWAGLDRRRAAQ